MHDLICGVDEAGRGPLAGKVYAAAVILDPQRPIIGLADSKKLSAHRREELFTQIIHNALAYSVASATEVEIDSLNILQATLLAMKRAILALSVTLDGVQTRILPTLVQIDGNQIPPGLDLKCEAIIGGDASIAAISAASILAKVSRDREMLQLDILYPEYGFAQHKGYGTKVHLAALQQFGVLPIHRRSFAPIKNMRG